LTPLRTEVVPKFFIRSLTSTIVDDEIFDEGIVEGDVEAGGMVPV
jgi:hypothetical protein